MALLVAARALYAELGSQVQPGAANQDEVLNARPVLLDVRAQLGNPSWGIAQYAEGHIADAEYLHLDLELSNLSRATTEGRHPLPDPRAFALTIARLGLRKDSSIVVYDQDLSPYAARAWWLLRSAGFSRVRVLDGGYAAWLQAGLASSKARHNRPALAPMELRFDLLPTFEFTDVLRNLSKGEKLLMDARTSARFAGLEEPIDPVAGHIPGAINRPFGENLQNGLFKTSLQLRAEFEALLQGRTANQIAHMCGSGVTACHNLFAMEIAGLSGSALFAPSWSGWICDPSRPVVLKDQAG